VGESYPFLNRGRSEIAEGTNGALTRAIGRVDRFYKEIVSVAFTFVLSGTFADIHLPLLISLHMPHVKNIIH
jgi:hypothetical protein